MKLKSWSFWLVVGLALQALDALFTVLLLKTGQFAEFNPLMVWMFEGEHLMHGLLLKCSGWLVVMGLVALPGAREWVRLAGVLTAVVAMLAVNTWSLSWVLRFYL